SKLNAHTDSLLALQISCSDIMLTCLKFKSQPVIEGVTFGFLHIDEHVLLPLIAFWIFDRRIYLAENSQIVELLLGIQHVNLTQGIARLHNNLALHYKRPRVV